MSLDIKAGVLTLISPLMKMNPPPLCLLLSYFINSVHFIFYKYSAVLPLVLCPLDPFPCLCTVDSLYISLIAS